MEFATIVGAQVRAQILFDDSGVLGTPFLDRGQKHHQTLAQRQQTRGKQRERETQRKGADANTHGAHILPGCGDDNCDAHKETLDVDTALPEHLCQAETGCAMSCNLTTRATEI